MLLRVQGLPGVINVLDFVSQEQMENPNFIVMERKGSNLASYRRSLGALFN